MAAERTFWHKGLRVDVWSKSFKWTGLPFTVFLGSPPDDDKIRKMIDTAQKPVGNDFRPELRRRSLRERFLLWWYGVGITPPEEIVGTFTGPPVTIHFTDQPATIHFTGPPVTKEMQQLFGGYAGHGRVTGIIQLAAGIRVTYQDDANVLFAPLAAP